MSRPDDAPENEHLLDFVNTAAIGLHRVASDGTILWANKADYEPLGYTADEYIGHNITEFHADADVIADILKRLSAGERLHDYEARLRCKDGSIRTVQITSSVLFSEGEFVHTRCFTRDVTEKKRSEEALKRALERAEEAVRARDVFLAIAAHELRTPITPLRLHVESLLKTLAGGKAERLTIERLASRLGIASRQVVRLEVLVNDLLDVSRLASGSMTLSPEDVELVALVREVVERHQAEAREAGVSLHLREHAPLWGHWDRARLERVVTNLLSNALKHGQGAPVFVSFDASDTHARLIVRDEGPGIPQADQTRIFERFERASSTRHLGGLGLGLWLVRQTAEALGGRVTLESGEGRGATFTVELPRRPAQEPAHGP